MSGSPFLFHKIILPIRGFQDTRNEVEKILTFLTGTPAIMATLLYGSGLRLMECHRLRVKDIDFEQRQITVRDGKGGKDRVTVLPESILPELRNHLEKTKALHKEFSRQGYGEVELPYALERKSQRQIRMGVAVCVSRKERLYRSADRSQKATPHS